MIIIVSIMLLGDNMQKQLQKDKQLRDWETSLR